MRYLLILVTAILCADRALAAKPIRFLLHGNMSHELPSEEYLRFVERVRPDVLVMGVFDQRLYATAYPDNGRAALAPAELLGRWRQIAERLHRSGIKLVGQMELFVVSDRPVEREQKTGWFGFYERGWDARLLGPRPRSSASDLLEAPDFDRHEKVAASDAFALCGCRVNKRALRGCASNPDWQVVQKAMVKAALDIGVDGFLTNRNYFEHCACAHCQRGFRSWLTERFTAEQLRERFGLPDLKSGNLCVVGEHRDHDKTPTPLLLEKMRSARHAVHRHFDAVFTEHARRLRPDVILGQWNHMAYFDELHLDRGHLPTATRTSFAHAQADERWGLPLDAWGKGEDLFWYCNWGTTQNTILDKEYAGDTVLYGKYLRSLARGKAYVINKYDYYRPRVMMAEAAALGYATNALDTPWQTAQDRDVVCRYFDFLREHEALFTPADTYADVALVFPRRAVEAGDASPLEYVEAAGRTMIRNHVLFDMLPDEMLVSTPLARYRCLVLAGPEYLQPAEQAALEKYVAAGGKVLWTVVSDTDRQRPGAACNLKLAAVPLSATRVEGTRLDREAFRKALANTAPDRTRFDAPWTVEAHAYRQSDRRRLVVHLVNYNHNEKATGKSITERESPIAAAAVKMNLLLPADYRVRSVTFLSPDAAGSQKLDFRQNGRRLEATTPGFLVYGVCVIQGSGP